MKGVSYSGLDKLDKEQVYLFICNYCDIVMDLVLVNYGLYMVGYCIVWIVIGDNFLKKFCVIELMCLNKSFIVKCLVKGLREMMKVFGMLLVYIKYLLEIGYFIWIV